LNCLETRELVQRTKIPVFLESGWEIYMINNLMLKFLLFICFFIQVSCVSAQDEDAGELGFLNDNQKYQVSIYTIAGNPKFYDKKPVYLKGYAGLYYDLFLFPDKASCIDAFVTNSISVSLVSSKYEDLAKRISNCETVTIFGKYSVLNEYGRKTDGNLNLGLLNNVEIYD
jgi:hypothetical protein